MDEFSFDALCNDSHSIATLQASRCEDSSKDDEWSSSWLVLMNLCLVCCFSYTTRTIMWAHIIRWNTAKKIQWKYNRSDFVVTDCTSTRVRVLQYFVTIKFGADLETLAMICPIRSSMHAIVPAGKRHWHFPHLSKLKVYGSQILNYLSRFTLHWNMHGVGWGFNSFHKFQNAISYIRV